jgi:peptide/nickel transport system permease protein
MGAYILHRVFYFIPTILLVTLITYALGYYGPGDPIRIMMGTRVSDQAAYENLRHQYGLDRPFLVQWGDYLWKALHGDFGVSFVYRDQAVGPRIFEGLAVSAQLALVAAAFAFGVGISLGVAAALWRNSPIDYAIGTVIVLTSSIPAYVLAPSLMILLVIQLRVLSVVPLGWDGLFSEKVILPAFILSLGPMVLLMRQARASVVEVLSADYVRTARAKGLRPGRILWRHVFRGALTPVVTVGGLLWAELITGAVFIESIFGIPGFGRLFTSSITSRDYSMLMGTILLASVILMVANLLVDLCYGLLDPRIRYD